MLVFGSPSMETGMPEVSRFYGIIIGMFYRDHAPPHFHASFGEFEASVDIATGRFSGPFPPRARSLVLAWLAVHRRELHECWRAARAGRPWGESALWSDPMDYHIVDAHYITGHVVRLRFRNGTSGEIDLGSELVGPVFEPLRDVNEFRRFRLDPTWHTLIWPNGADMAPEHLYHLVRIGSSRP